MNIKAGFATLDFTPEAGLPLLGQMHERIATHARDSLFACAAAFESNGVAAVVVAVDVCILDAAFVARTQAAWAQQSECPVGSLLIHATHTHVAPVSTGTLIGKGLPEFEEALSTAVVKAALAAWEKREPCELFAATGYLEQLGWNRRAMMEDGTSRMYADASVPGFAGLEGPRDGAAPALWARNEAGKIIGVLTGFATHPNCLEGECFYSADLPGETRKHLGAALGGVPVVYLTGAAGNTAPSVLEVPEEVGAWRNESGVVRSGQLLAGEVLKLIAVEATPIAEPAVALAHSEIEVPLRQFPTEGEPSFPLPLVEDLWIQAKPYYEKARDTWPARRAAAQGTMTVKLNVLRIGDVVICANPAELFVEFGLEIKAESPARVTFISELTDGWCGYVPTLKAFSRGGYETWCAPSSGLAFEAGDMIVAGTRELLKQAFDE